MSQEVEEEVAIPSWIVPAPVPDTATSATAEDVVAYNNMLALQYSENHHRIVLSRLAERSKNPDKGRSLGGYVWVKTDEIGNPQILVGDKSGGIQVLAEFVIGGMWIHRVRSYNHHANTMQTFFVQNYTNYVSQNEKFFPNKIDDKIIKNEGLVTHEIPWSYRGSGECTCNDCQTHLAPWLESVKKVNNTIKLYRDASAIEPVYDEEDASRYSRAMKWFIPYDMDSEKMGNLCEPIYSQWQKIQTSRGWERKENTIQRGR